MLENTALPLGKPASLFLSLPPEVRDCIYDAALDWPKMSVLAETVSRSDATTLHEHPKSPLSSISLRRYGLMSTPSLLLLNRQITSEALEVLYRKPVILNELPPRRLGQPMSVTEIISETTLQNIRFVVMRIDLDQKLSGRDWSKVVSMLLEIWRVKNSLEKVQIWIQRDPLVEHGTHTFGEAMQNMHARMLLSKVRLVETKQGKDG